MAIEKQTLIDQIEALYVDGDFSEADARYLINYLLSNGNVGQSPRDLIQVRRGLKDDLPRLAQGELAFTTDEEMLYIGGENGNIPLSDKVAIESINKLISLINENLGVLQKGLFDHTQTMIHESEAHGIRINEGAFEFFDGEEWVELQADGSVGGTKIYGVKIDTLNSNPASAVTYTDDAIGMTGGSSAWDSLFPFNQIRPVMLKNGIVNYELDKNDFTKKSDGSLADITSGVDGDVMIEFPKVYWKFEKVGTDLHIRISKTQVDPSWKCYGHTKGTTEKEFSYIGAYLGFTETGKLRSLSGKKPTDKKDIGTFRTEAQANGGGYRQMGYFQFLMLQVLYLIRYKNLDSQSALGKGYTAGHLSTSTNTGGANLKGMNFGETGGSQQMKFAGVEDLYGNVWQWVDGLFLNSVRNIMLATDNFNNTGAGYTDYGLSIDSENRGYIKEVQGGTETGFIVKNRDGSTSTYYCDTVQLKASNSCFVGSIGGSSADAGIFEMRCPQDGTGIIDRVGSRLCYL